MPPFEDSPDRFDAQQRATTEQEDAERCCRLRERFLERSRTGEGVDIDALECVWIADRGTAG